MLSRFINNPCKVENNVTFEIQDFLIEETVGEQKKRAAVMIGRMNPPTEGHYKVIDKMKEFIRKNPEMNLSVTPIVVIVAGAKSSEDKSKNPLTADERVSFMKSSGRANGVIFLTAKNGFEAWEEVRKRGFEPIAIAAGSDRAKSYKEMLDKYYTAKDGKNIKHVIVPGLGRKDIDADSSDGALAKAVKKLQGDGEIDIAEVSGSMARAAVTHGFEEAFAKIVGLANKPKLAKMMFNKIKSSMGSE